MGSHAVISIWENWTCLVLKHSSPSQRLCCSPLASVSLPNPNGKTGVQPELGSRSAPIINFRALRFRDLDRSGDLTRTKIGAFPLSVERPISSPG